MPKLDKAKFWLGIFVVFFGGLVSFIATNHKTFEDGLVFYGACLGAIVLLILIFFGNKQSKKILKEIRDLKK